MNRRLPLAAAVTVVACFPATALGASSVTAKTTRGGSCRIQEVASRSPTAITYGVQVAHCQDRVRYAISSGFLHDETHGGDPDGSDLARKRGHAPYGNTMTWMIAAPNMTDDFFTRSDVSIVLKRPRPGARHPKTWKDPGELCRVASTYRSADTLACQFTEQL